MTTYVIYTDDPTNDVIRAGVDLSNFARIASPAFTGIPQAPTAAPGTATTQIANCAFVDASISTAIAGDLAYEDQVNIFSDSNTFEAPLILTKTPDPAAVASGAAKLYIEENESGALQLKVKFPSGPIRVIATQSVYSPGFTSVATDTGTTPVNIAFTLGELANGFRIFVGERPLNEESFMLYMRVNGGPIKKIKLYRWKSRIINAPPGASVALATADGSPLRIAQVITPGSLPVPTTVSGTANADEAMVPLWAPAAPHVTLADYNQQIKVTSATTQVIFVSEFTGAAWTEPTWYRLMAGAAVTIQCTFKQIALGNEAGTTLDVVAPAGAVIGGVKTTMHLTMPTGATLNVASGDEADLRAKCNAAVAGQVINIPLASYNLTAAPLWTANGGTSNGIIFQGNGATIKPTTANWTFSGNSSYAKDLIFDTSGGGVVNATDIAFLRWENVRVTGSNGTNDNFVIRMQNSTPTDQLYLKCDVNGAFADGWNFYQPYIGTGNRLVMCRGTNCGQNGANNSQCLTGHVGSHVQIYGGYFGDTTAGTVIIAPENPTITFTWCFFTKFSGGSLVNGVATYACDFANVGTASGVVTPIIYALFNYFSNAGGSIFRCSASSPANYATARHNYIVGWAAGRAFHPSIGGWRFEHNVVVGVGAAEAFRHADYVSGVQTQGVTAGNTVYNNGTGFLWAGATPLPTDFHDNITHTMTTSVNLDAATNAVVAKSHNVLDPTVDSDYTADASDITGGNAAIDTTTFLPTAAGNCDRNGDATKIDWCGDSDPWGWVMVSKQGSPSRGARERPAYDPTADLFPDIW